MITVFGSINLDLIFPLDRLPGPGETLLGPAMRIEPGGKGANQAVAAALEGADVMMAGAIGTDALAAEALSGLLRAKVDVSRVARVAETTGCAAICTDRAGRNQIAVASGANGRARADQIEPGLLTPGNTILMQMETDPAETAALIRRNRGARLVLNLAPAVPLDMDALRAVDVLVVNEHEAAWLGERLGSGPTARELYDELGLCVVRTLGPAGVDFAGRGVVGHVAAIPIAAVDSTAAGDCFTGVMATGLDQGLELTCAIARANVAAALCCTRPGSQRSLPSQGEIDVALGRVDPSR